MNRTETVTCDGGQMDLYVWEPEGEPKGALLLVQEILGVGDYIKDVAVRLTADGYRVGAPDVFWRISPQWAVANDMEGLQASLALVQQLDFPQAIADCTAALDHLSATPGLSEPAGVIGFCLGGTLAYGVAMQGEPSVCVSYYGSGVPDMIGGIDAVHCPTLFHFGNADMYIPNEGVDKVGAAIAGREGFVVNVENAGHAFDNHKSDIFWNESAAKAAWAKTMAFLQLYLDA